MRSYIAIDLKSYYASVECVDLGVNPLTTNLVVADESRTEKTICLAVSPSLKSYGIPGRARLFEVVQKVKEVNRLRLAKAPGNVFTGSSSNADELAGNPSLKLSYIVARPRMRRYMKSSTDIYNIYLKYVSPEDIHVYSIDECFIDVTDYLELYSMTARELCVKLIQEVYESTGITATGGIGSNLYLAKIAMDIVAKHVAEDKNGVRIAELDEYSYRKELWTHEPITDFWRVGKGIAKKLYEKQIYTMGDIARVSIGLPPSDFINQGEAEQITLRPDGRVINEHPFYNEELLYKLFGVNAEFLIDHAWGYEPALISDIKAYRPENNSLSTGQVLSEPYDYEKGAIIVREMTDLLVLDLVEKGLVTDQIVLTIGYDIDNSSYKGQMVSDHYGRMVPKPAHSSINLDRYCSSTSHIIDKTLELYRTITDKRLLIRRLTIAANHVIREEDIPVSEYEQLDLFTDYTALENTRLEEKQADVQEKNLQKAIISVHKKFGKNAILKGTNLLEGATTIERNSQVGGHRG